MTEEVINKKKTIQILIFGFFGSILFAFIVAMIITNGQAFSGEEGKIVLKAFLISSGFLLIVFIISGFAGYKWAKKHPKRYQEINSSEGKKNTSISIIIFGISLILYGGYSHFITNPPTELKFVLIEVVFGIITIIWGIYYLIKSKS